MPLYEYRCKQCGHRFEKIQTFSAPDQKECPICKGEVERLISAPAVHFSGSGFYSTDYGTKPAVSKSSESGSSEASGSGGDGNKAAAPVASGDAAAKSSSDSGNSSTPKATSGKD